MEKSYFSRFQQSSSLSLFTLFRFFLVVFFRWVSSARIFLSRTFFLQHQQRVSEKKNKDLEFSDQKQNLITHIEEEEEEEEEDDGLCREDVEIVMRSLGLVSDSKSEELQEVYNSKEISSLFEEKETSLEEVKQAFDVFDENRDGFIDAKELQRVLTILGLKEGSNLENCIVMIRSLDGNKEDRTDFHDFVKLLDNSFC